jgi:hypothetical protein
VDHEPSKDEHGGDAPNASKDDGLTEPPQASDEEPDEQDQEHEGDEGDQGGLGRVGLAMEHRLPREQPSDRYAVETAGQPFLSGLVDRPCLDTVHPPQRVEPRVRLDDVTPDPAAGPMRVGAGADHVVEGRVDPDLETPAGGAQRTAHAQIVELEQAPRVGRPPADGAPARHRHGEDSAAIGREDRARLEVGAESDDLLARRHGVNSAEREA